MKKFLFFICLSAIIVSCKKSDSPPTNLTGTWEMVRQLGMDYNTPFATGQGNILQFNAGNKYILYSNFQQIDIGTYLILKKGDTKINKNFDAIFFGEDISAISIKKDSLTISTAPNDAKGNLIMDGGSTLYVRQK